MSFNSTYRTLFELKFRHLYFLNEGADEFSEVLDEDWMTTNLRAFDIRTVLDITPTQETIKLLRNLRAKFVYSKDSLLVLMRTENSNQDVPFIGFIEDQAFDFLIGIRDSYFENYTQITLDRTKYTLLSNKTPTASVEETALDVVFSKFSEFGVSSTDLTIDLLDTIDSNELIGKMGIIRVHTTGDLGEITLTNPGGDEFNAVLPSVTISFENRKTYWRYLNASDATEIFTTNDENPLTKYGYVKITHSGTEYPNPNIHLIVTDEDTGDVFSEVFM